ncbi:MAG: S1/P1 nuclease [Paludibacteraceae bacterium]|nr:S1/P1 nuclease [Paludibacteraceae bacterium]
MKKHILYALICAAGLSMYSLPALGWGQEGHRIIAKIAYDHLHRGVRKKVDKISGTQGIIHYANWPDEIKSDTIYPTSYDWHFQDFNGGMSDSAVVAALSDYPQEGGNLFRAMDSLVKEANACPRSLPKEEKDRVRLNHTLRFIVHLAGDRYCPMHTAHMDDRGGNDVKMKWFGRDTRLHTVWDTHLIESQGYSYTEYVRFLELKYRHRKKAIEQMTDEELLLHNYHFTEAIYEYQQTWDGNTYHYIYRWHEPMEEQLYIAGIRLAQLLNKIYK